METHHVRTTLDAIIVTLRLEVAKRLVEATRCLLGDRFFHFPRRRDGQEEDAPPQSATTGIKIISAARR